MLTLIRSHKWMAFVTLLIAVAAAVVITIALGTFSASAATSVGHDPVGDATDDAPAYLDLKKVTITEQRGKGTIKMVFNYAAPIPKSFSSDEVVELFNLAMNPLTESEATVVVRWNGSNSIKNGNDAYEAIVFSSGQPVPGAIDSFKVSGSQVTATVNTSTIGNPDSFTWFALVRSIAFTPPNPFTGVVDFAPNAGVGPAGPVPAEFGTWTSGGK